MKIAQIGLGKIGSCFLAVFAHRGFKTIGIDLDKNIVEKINHGVSPFPETNLQMLIQQNRENIQATTKITEAIPKTDMAFVRVPTPSKPNGGFNHEYVETAVAEICRAIPTKKKYYNIIITSTVMPGSMEKIANLAERISNRKLGETLGVCYMPDWVALGSVIQNILNPDVAIIGESDQKAGAHLEIILKDIVTVTHLTPLHRMNFINSEISKLVLNNYISMKISYTNTITEYCEKFKEGDAQTVLNAIGEDNRVGKKFLKPGLGYGGFCFPRDQKAFIQSAKNKGIVPRLAETVDEINDYIDKRISVKLMRMIKNKKIAVLGISYKPDTPYTKESTTIKIIDNLLKSNVKVAVYDPSLTLKGITTLNEDADFYEEVEDCLKSADTVFIGTPWKQFRDIDKKLFKNKTIIDAFGILKKLENNSDMNYIRIGTNKFNTDFIKNL